MGTTANAYHYPYLWIGTDYASTYQTGRKNWLVGAEKKLKTVSGSDGHVDQF